MPKIKKSAPEFDAELELAKIRKSRDLSRRVPFQRSKLGPFDYEIKALKQQGASLRDIQTWLRREHGVKVHPSTISRYLKQHGGLFFNGRRPAEALSEL